MHHVLLCCPCITCYFVVHASRVTLLSMHHVLLCCAKPAHACMPTMYRKFETNIHRNEAARPHSQFSTLFHVSVSDLYIAVLRLRTIRVNIYIIAHRFMNVEIGNKARAVSFLGKFVSNFRDSAFAWLNCCRETGMWCIQNQIEKSA
jgi:hypothetical protein